MYGGKKLSCSMPSPCSAPLRSGTCPVSTEGGTRRVQLVRERGGGGGTGEVRGARCAPGEIVYNPPLFPPYRSPSLHSAPLPDQLPSLAVSSSAPPRATCEPPWGRRPRPFCPPPPPLRTNRTRRVPHPVLIGHVVFRAVLVDHRVRERVGAHERSAACRGPRRATRGRRATRIPERRRRVAAGEAGLSRSAPWPRRRLKCREHLRGRVRLVRGEGRGVST